jgi:hypothetical protein
MGHLDPFVRSVAFLGPWTSDDDIDPCGTGFFVGHKNGYDTHIYFATAAHVVEKLGGKKVGLRLNESDAGFGVCPIEPNWFASGKSDAAVMPIEIPKWAEVRPFETKYFATSFKVDSKDFGAGDAAHVIGLFKRVYGKKRNLPVVYSGNIAMMPGDEDLVMTGGDGKAKTVRGFLVEAQAASGSSGAPVFVRRTLPIRMVTDTNNGLVGTVDGSIWLFGLWSGSWPGTPSESQVESGASTGIKVPLGIGIVTPADAILYEIKTHLALK